jgi:hypothetical protein
VIAGVYYIFYYIQSPSLFHFVSPGDPDQLRQLSLG